MRPRFRVPSTSARGLEHACFGILDNFLAEPVLSIFLCWVVFPLALVLIAVGCGLLLEVLSGFQLRGPLVPAAGLAMVIVVGDFATALSGTAPWATPLVVALAVCGYGLTRRLRGGPQRGWARLTAPLVRLDRWAAGGALAVYAVYAVPIVLSGSATFAGYITLDDTATWLALTDHVMQHGRSLSGLAPSTHQQVLRNYLGSGYPLGSFIPLGVGGQLTGQDIAWLFQPTIATYGAMLGLSLYTLCADLVASRRLRALVALLGAQPALLFQYAFWSGIKEMAAATILALIGAVFCSTIRQWSSLRGALPAAMAVGALLAVLSIAGGFWLVIPAILVAVMLIRRSWSTFLGSATRLLALSAVLSIPTLALAVRFVESASGTAGRLNDTGGLFGSIHLGNLGHPLNDLQVLGIWPATDFRSPVQSSPLTHVMFVVLGVAIAFALAVAWRRRAWSVPLYLAAGAGGFLFLLLLGHAGLSSPWLDAKAMAEGSPAVLTAGFAGSAAAFLSGRRTAAVLGGLAIAAGVVWSNGLSYGNVWLAPRAQLAELETIGHRFAGDGPALMTEFQPYGARHFLRFLNAEAAGELRVRVVPLRSGGALPTGQYADLDRFQLGAILVYRTLVLRTSPVESRPPSVYHLVWKGHWYEVWQRAEDPSTVLAHLSLGTALRPAAVPSCPQVLRLASQAHNANGRLATVARPRAPVVVNLAESRRPSSWGAADGSFVPTGSGAASVATEVPASGTYELWVGGSSRRRLTASVDGHRVGSISDQLNNTGQWTPLGDTRLTRGRHEIRLSSGGSALAPGSGGFPFRLGPLVLSTRGGEPAVAYVSPANAGSLCGKQLDWIEAVG
jgi:hypothetical protein